MKRTVADSSKVILEPETVEECGLLVWLAERFKGKPIAIEFGTRTTGMTDGEMPSLWITTAFKQPRPDTSAKETK